MIGEQHSLVRKRETRFIDERLRIKIPPSQFYIVFSYKHGITNIFRYLNFEFKETWREIFATKDRNCTIENFDRVIVHEFLLQLHDKKPHRFEVNFRIFKRHSNFDRTNFKSMARLSRRIGRCWLLCCVQRAFHRG